MAKMMAQTSGPLGSLVDVAAALDVTRVVISVPRAGRMLVLVSMSGFPSVSSSDGAVFAQRAYAVLSGPSDVGPYVAAVAVYEGVVTAGAQITIASDRKSDISAAVYAASAAGRVVQFASNVGDLGGVTVSLPSISPGNYSLVLVGGHDRDYLANHQTFNIDDPRFVALRPLNHAALMSGESTWAGYAQEQLTYKSSGSFGTGWAVIIVELQP